MNTLSSPRTRSLSRAAASLSRIAASLAPCAVPLGLAAAVVVASVALVGTAHARPWWMRDSKLSDQGFLDPDVAFRVRATIEGSTLHLHWTIADGYYLYRAKMQLRAESPDLTVAAVDWPAGVSMVDPNFGPQQVYVDAVDASAAFERSDFGAHPLQVKVVYQGCAKAGLCYPPITRVLYPTASAATEPALTASAAPSTTLAGAGADRASRRWEVFAILGGGAAFVLAGLMLRKNRRLPMPS